MSSTGQVVPEGLLEIPEIHELNQIVEQGILAPFDIIEVTLPPLSPEQRTILTVYLRTLEEDSDYLTEHHVFEDKEVILITMVPIKTMMLISGRA